MHSLQLHFNPHPEERKKRAEAAAAYLANWKATRLREWQECNTCSWPGTALGARWRDRSRAHTMPHTGSPQGQLGEAAPAARVLP